VTVRSDCVAVGRGEGGGRGFDGEEVSATGADSTIEGDGFFKKFKTSSFSIRPCGPVGVMRDRSMLFSFAMRLTAGVVLNLEWSVTSGEDSGSDGEEGEEETGESAEGDSDDGWIAP